MAVLITLLDQNIIDYRYIAGALVAGSLVGFFAATRVKMTSMPEMVAIFNGFGGIASLLVGSAEYVSGAFDNPAFLGGYISYSSYWRNYFYRKYHSLRKTFRNDFR